VRQEGGLREKKGFLARTDERRKTEIVCVCVCACVCVRVCVCVRDRGARARARERDGGGRGERRGKKHAIGNIESENCTEDVGLESFNNPQEQGTQANHTLQEQQAARWPREPEQNTCMERASSVQNTTLSGLLHYNFSFHRLYQWS